MGRIAVASIERMIVIVRRQRVILDSDLSRVYGVETRVLNQAVRRNQARFPGDFCFRLTSPEFAFLISQSVISSHGRDRSQ